jgi:adenosylcobinamide-GDP ribazoletransferase
MTGPVGFLRAGRAAATFLTRIPVGGFPYGDDEWQWSSSWFPVIGAALGAIYAAVWWLVAPALGAAVAACVVIAAALMITGAFHEDGLADTADALGGGYTRDRVLEILKDSRVGAFGAAALVVALGLRAALLVRLGPAAPAALIAVECASRLPPVWLMAAMPYATADAQSRSRLLVRARPGQVAAATALTMAVLVAGALAGAWSVAACGGAVVAGAATAVCLGRWFAWRVGGVTGDFLGATQQVALCAGLAAWIVVSGA